MEQAYEDLKHRLQASKEELHTANQKFLAVQRELSVTKRELSMTKQELSVAKQELSVTKQELAVAQHGLLVMKEEIIHHKELLKTALDRITELEAKINRNSRNSSKPPSTDQKSDTPKYEGKKSRRSHPGKSRTPYPQERVDRHVDCTLTNCPHCSSQDLFELLGESYSWQQVDLPPAQAIVTQFDCRKYFCRHCGQHSVGDLPAGTLHSSFGPRLMALLATLTGRFHISKREAILLIRDLYGIELSVGSAINVEERVANALDGVYEQIHRFVIESSSARFFDETGWRDSGKRHYVWLATSVSAAYYMIDRHRSREAFFKLVANNLGGSAVTDRFNAYNALDGPHQYCLAHLIRDFHFFADQPGDTGETATKIEQELRIACRIHTAWRKKELTDKQKVLRLAHSRRRLENYFVDAIAFCHNDLANLCLRLDEEMDRLWVFASVKDVEPTNNMAERDLRKLVLWRKKSYGTRSPRGRRFVERITSVVETIKKNGINVLDFLETSVRAFINRQPAPLINPALGI
jgi:transposase